jgi:hypothetical protein
MTDERKAQDRWQDKVQDTEVGPEELSDEQLGNIAGGAVNATSSVLKKDSDVEGQVISRI